MLGVIAVSTSYHYEGFRRMVQQQGTTSFAQFTQRYTFSNLGQVETEESISNSLVTGALGAMRPGFFNIDYLNPTKAFFPPLSHHYGSFGFKIINYVP